MADNFCALKKGERCPAFTDSCDGCSYNHPENKEIEELKTVEKDQI